MVLKKGKNGVEEEKTVKRFGKSLMKVLASLIFRITLKELCSGPVVAHTVKHTYYSV